MTANKPIHAKRAALAKQVPKFWLNALANNMSFVPFIDPVDKEAFEFLEDVWIEHNEEDPRDFEIRFVRSFPLAVRGGWPERGPQEIGRAHV